MNPQDDFEKLDRALTAGGLAWWQMELPSGVIFFSENKTKMLGLSAADFVHYTNFTDIVHPDDYENMMQAMRDHISGSKEYYATQYRIKASDGQYRTFYDRGRMVQRDGERTVLAGIVIDITDPEDSLGLKIA